MTSAAWARKLLPDSAPVRVLVAASFISSIGYGLYLTGGAVYFVRSVGLSPTEVGLGYSVAGLVCLPLGVPIGYLADRFGARDLTILMIAAQVTLLVLVTRATTFTGYLALITLLGIAERGTYVAGGAVMAALVGKGKRAQISALSRSVYNAGFTIGLFSAGLALGVDRRWAYVLLILGNAAMSAVVGIMYLFVPRTARDAGTVGGRERVSALRDLPYLAVAMVTGLGEFSETILLLGLPVWVVTHTSAPRPLAAWLTATNTVLVVLFQVRSARSADSPASAGRLQRLAFLALAASTLLLSGTGVVPSAVAVPLLLGAVVVITFGEMWGEAARWALRYELAPANAQGRYGAIFGLGLIVPTVTGPTMVTSLPQHRPVLGWWTLSAIFLLGYALSRPALAWAIRTRPVADEPAAAPELDPSSHG